MPKEYQTAIFSPDTMNNVNDPFEVGQHSVNGVYDQAVYMANIDPAPVKRLRQGQLNVLPVSSLSSGWSNPYNPIEGFFVNGTILNHIDLNGNITAIRYDMIPGLPVNFVQVNDVIAYSNGIQFGVIENGADTAPFYPPGTVKNQQGSFIPSYKLRMVPGKFMEFYNGRLYALVDNYQGKPCVLICSDSLDTPGWIESMDTRQNIVASFDGEGTMLTRVDDGLFVGTTIETFFLSLKDAVFDGGLERQITVAPYAVIPGTVYPIKGERTILKRPGNFQMWASARGACFGGNGGFFLNVTEETVSYPPGQVGTALIREQNGEVHYVCSMQQPGIPYDKFQRSLT